MRLIEVVDVETQAPLRRREDTEVRQVGIAAGLDVDAARGQARQIGRHDQCGAAQEGEWRDQHPAVADGHEIRDARLALLDQQCDRVGSIRRHGPVAVGAERHLRAACPARCAVFRRRVALDGSASDAGRRGVGLTGGVR